MRGINHPQLSQADAPGAHSLTKTSLEKIDDTNPPYQPHYFPHQPSLLLPGTPPALAWGEATGQRSMGVHSAGARNGQGEVSLTQGTWLGLQSTVGVGGGCSQEVRRAGLGAWQELPQLM